MLPILSRQLLRSFDVKGLPTRFLSTTNFLKADEGSPTAEEREVIIGKEKKITMIGINRPAQRNAINSKAATELCKAFSDFENDDSSSVAVLYGLGGSFCAGYDVRELATEGDKISIDILMKQEGSVGPTRRHLLKPVVCAINGYCVANGLELALMCDLRVMEESAILGFFNRRFGVPVIDGGTTRLPAMIGLSRALDLILTGRHVSADEAHEMGIANCIVPTGDSFNRAIELATTLSKFPQGALLHDRRSVYSAVFGGVSFDQAIQNEIMYTSKDIIEEMKEGIKWFNRTYSEDAPESWLKSQKSMADWDDEEVVRAAEKQEEEKQAVEAEKKDAEKQKNGKLKSKTPQHK